MSIHNCTSSIIPKHYLVSLMASATWGYLEIQFPVVRDIVVVHILAFKVNLLVPFKSGVAHPEGLWGKTREPGTEGTLQVILLLFRVVTIVWAGEEGREERGGEGRGREVSLEKVLFAKLLEGENKIRSTSRLQTSTYTTDVDLNFTHILDPTDVEYTPQTLTFLSRRRRHLLPHLFFLLRWPL